LSKESLRVELQVGSVDFGACTAEALGDRLENANDAIYDMWQYIVSDGMKDVLNKDKK